MRLNFVRQQAEALAERGGTAEPPIDVDSIAEMLELPVTREDLGPVRL